MRMHTNMSMSRRVFPSAQTQQRDLADPPHPTRRRALASRKIPERIPALMWYTLTRRRYRNRRCAQPAPATRVLPELACPARRQRLAHLCLCDVRDSDLRLRPGITPRRSIPQPLLLPSPPSAESQFAMAFVSLANMALSEPQDQIDQKVQYSDENSPLWRRLRAHSRYLA